jgi:MFS family permease
MATTNGLAMLGGSVAKSLGPLLAGFLVTESVAWFGPSGSLLMYGVLGVLGALLALACYTWLGDEEIPTTTAFGDPSYELVSEWDEKDPECESSP